MTTGAPVTARRLVALDDEIQPSQLLLTDEPCTIGRGAGNRIVVPRQTVSRLHARIVQEGDQFMIADMGSRNGTFVNGHLLEEPRTLLDRDAIGLGDPEPLFRFVDDVTVLAARAVSPPHQALTYDERLLRFSLRGQLLDVTPNEFRLLLHLFRSLGAVCSRESCAAAIWGEDYPPGRDAATLDKVISTLRRKLRGREADGNPLRTRAGFGYLLDL